MMHPIQQLATSIIFQAEVTHAGGVPVERLRCLLGDNEQSGHRKWRHVGLRKRDGRIYAIAKNLKPNTLYYIRPYATNSVGTSYGDEFQKNTTKGLGVMRTFVIDSLIRAEVGSRRRKYIRPGRRGNPRTRCLLDPKGDENHRYDSLYDGSRLILPARNRFGAVGKL